MPIGQKSYTTNAGTELIFFYDYDALVMVEEKVGRSFGEILDGLRSGKPRLGDLRALIWAGLQRYHPELTLTDAGELVLSEGIELGATMREAMAAAMPEPEPGGRRANPTNARRGNGASSSARGSRRGSTRKHGAANHRETI